MIASHVRLPLVTKVVTSKKTPVGKSSGRPAPSRRAASPVGP